MRKLRKIKFIIILCVLLVTFLSLVGCNNSKKYESKTETPQVVTDENKKHLQYITEEHPDVAKAKQVASDYSKAFSNRDYKTIKGDEEFTYLSKNETKRRNDSNYKKSAVDFYKKYEIVSKFEDLNISKVEFNKDFSTAVVTAVLKVQYVEAKDNFLKLSKLEKNSVAQRNVTINLIKQDGNWGVDNVVMSNIKASK